MLEWLDAPDKAGMWWMSPFCDGKYVSLRLIRVIDYSFAGKGLEVDNDRDSIPVKFYCTIYHPNAKWLYIPEPDITILNNKEGK